MVGTYSVGTSSSVRRSFWRFDISNAAVTPKGKRWSTNSHMAKRKSAGEPGKSAQPARRSSRNSDTQSRAKSSSTKSAQKGDDTTTVVVPTKKAKTSNVPSYPALLNFDVVEAIRVQKEYSEFFYMLPEALVISILFSGYFDTLFILRRLRPTCR